MSGWESIFGEGVSGDSVVDGINSEYFREMREAEAEHRRDRIAASLAYQSSEEVKAAFLSRLDAALNRGNIKRGQSTLENVLDLPQADFSSLEDELRIPRSLCSTISVYFKQTYECAAYMYPNKQEANVIQWLRDFFSAITPGMDLRFAVARFHVDIAQIAIAKTRRSMWTKKESAPVYQAAFDLLCARARGIVPPNYVLEQVRNALIPWIDKDAVEYPHQSVHPAPAMLAAFLDNDSEAALIIGATNDVGTASGDVDQFDFWRNYAWYLESAIKQSPKTRLRIIDFNRVLQGATLGNVTAE
jgi:hypothetical protein